MMWCLIALLLRLMDSFLSIKFPSIDYMFMAFISEHPLLIWNLSTWCLPDIFSQLTRSCSLCYEARSWGSAKIAIIVQKWPFFLNAKFSCISEPQYLALSWLSCPCPKSVCWTSIGWTLRIVAAKTLKVFSFLAASCFPETYSSVL